MAQIRSADKSSFIVYLPQLKFEKERIGLEREDTMKKNGRIDDKKIEENTSNLNN